MTLNISNLLNTLKGFYDTQSNDGERYTASKEDIGNLVSAYGMAEVTDVELTSENLSKDIAILNNTEKITISSQIPQNFSYKTDEQSGKVIIFGNNLTIDIPSGSEKYVEVIGISNVINSKDIDDNITLFGYDNKVNTNEGEDTVTVFGEDNTVNNAETIKIEDKENIFASISGLTSVVESSANTSGSVVIKNTDDNTPVIIEVDGKKYSLKMNKSTTIVPTEVTVEYEYDKATGEITFKGDNFSVAADDFQIDLIKLIGNKCVVESGDENDTITVQGDKNIVHSGEGADVINVDGKTNQILADDGDDVVSVKGSGNTIDAETVNYSEKTGSITLTSTEETSHYINVTVNDVNYKYLIQRNTTDNDDVSIDYEVTDDGELLITGDNVKIVSQSDIIDKVTIKGDNNYFDAGVGHDVINVVGDNSVIITGEGVDTVTVNGDGNQISGDESDIVNIESGKNKDFTDITANYTSQKGSVVITKNDTASHYINVEIDGETYKYLLQRNTTTDDDVEVEYEVDDNGKLSITGSNVKVIAQIDGRSDDITVTGNNNYIDAGDGHDNITIVGNNSSAITGDGIDTVTINGDNNAVVGDENDLVNIIGGENKDFEDVEVNYTSTSGTVVISSDDTSSHYVNIGDYSYLIQRNTSSTDDVKLTYKMNDDGTFEFEGSNFKIIAAKDGVADEIKVTGNNIYVDSGDGNDDISVIGNQNVVMAGDGDDNIYVEGNKNDIHGGLGTDTVAINGDENTTEDINYFKQVITLTKDWQSQTVESNGFSYTFQSTEELTEDDDKLVITYEYRDGQAIINADNAIIFAGKGQADNISFTGNNSKIYAMDKDDTINVVGDNNFIDGWTGDDTINAEGLNNKAYGFLGKDEINIVQRDNTEAEIKAEKANISTTDSDGNVRTDEEIEKIAKQNLLSNGVNYVDGEFDTDTVNASKYTKISVDTEIYTSQAQTIKLNPSEDKKRIVVDGKYYTITNYATLENNNPFVSTRSISYEIVDVTVNGETQKQLVVKGDYISVVADDGQEDNVKLIGNNSYVDLLDDVDYLEAEGDSNLLFGGIGADYLKVTGSENVINADKEDMASENDDDTIEVIGDNNTIKGGDGTDTLSVKGDNAVWSDVEVITGITAKRETLTNENRETEIIADDGKKYTIKINASDDVEIEEDVQFTYSIEDVVLEDGTTKKQLVIDGDNIKIIAESGQQDIIKIHGDDCVLELGDEDDIIDAYGSRNTVKAGDGDDKIKVYGSEYTVYGEGGKDDFDVRATESKIYSGDETSSTQGDTLAITGDKTNEYKGFDDKNVTTNPDKGVVILSEDITKNTLRYLDVDGSEIVFAVEPNLLPGEKLAGEIYIDYEVVDFEDADGNPQRKVIINASGVRITLTDASKSINAKIIGSDIRFETLASDDNIEVVGTKNEVYANDGQNTIIVDGSYNSIYGGKDIDTIDVDGDSNDIYSNGERDVVSLAGMNNNYMLNSMDNCKGGSLVLSKEIGPQNIVIGGCAYEVSIYGIPENEIESVSIPVSYEIIDGYLTFEANNIMIRAIDVKSTQVTDEKVTDNQHSLKLIGNNCYVFSGYGEDVIKVEGNNNILDGWYGDDSFEVVGDNNEIRGFDGDDVITITKGDNNKVFGEAGEDTLDIIEGENNTYESIEIIK